MDHLGGIIAHRKDESHGPRRSRRPLRRILRTFPIQQRSWTRCTSATSRKSTNTKSCREGEHDRGPLAPKEIIDDGPFTLPGFFAVLADDRLLASRYGECETRFVPPRPAYYACGSREVRLEEQPRSGEIVSFTAVHRPPSAFADLALFPVAVVEFDSGARLTGRVRALYEGVRIGMSVQLSVVDAEDTEHAALDYETDWPLHVSTAPNNV